MNKSEIYHNDKLLNIFVIGISAENLKPFKDVGFETLEINVQDILSQKWMNLPPVNGDQRSAYEEPLHFVSPANSLGYMDGGIDKAYMGMFNEIERKVKNGIKKLIPKVNNVTKLGRPYLPIGSAIKVKADDLGNFCANYVTTPTSYVHAKCILGNQSCFTCMVWTRNHIPSNDVLWVWWNGSQRSC
jgi:hypothetical protein